MSAGVDEVPEAGQEVTVRWARWADGGLWAAACSGFALSYSSVQRAAVAHVDHAWLSYLVPLVGDGAALAAAARYVADRRAGLPARGWQLLAWATIAASATLNAMNRTVADAVWHLVGPAALAAITELYARRAAQLHRLELDPGQERIPVRLWLTAPVASVRLWLWMARTGQRSMLAARRAMGRHAAALQALRTACRGRSYWRMRQVTRAQLRAGTLAPAAVLDVLGWTGDRPVPADPRAALQALLAAALSERQPTTSDDAEHRDVLSATASDIPVTAPEIEEIERDVLVERDASVERDVVERDVLPDRSRREVDSGGTSSTAQIPTGIEERDEQRQDVVPVERVQETPQRDVPSAGRRVRRTDAQLAAEIVAAIADGRLSSSPSADAVRTVLGGSWARASRILTAMQAEAERRQTGQQDVPLPGLGDARSKPQDVSSLGSDDAQGVREDVPSQDVLPRVQGGEVRQHVFLQDVAPGDREDETMSPAQLVDVA